MHFVIASCLKFYSSGTRLLTIWHLRTFAIYLYLTFHLVSNVHHLKIFSIPHFNLRTYGARSFSVAVPKLWNTLPSDIKNSPSVSVFKTDLKLSFLKKHFYNFFYNFLAIFTLVLTFEALLLFLLLLLLLLLKVKK